MTLERINVQGSYCKKNCTWVGVEKQALNRRNNYWVSYGGRRIMLEEAAKLSGISPQVLRIRMLKQCPKDHLFDPPHAGRSYWRKPILIEYQGRLVTCLEASRLTGIPYSTLRNRVKNKCPADRLFKEPRVRTN